MLTHFTTLIITGINIHNKLIDVTFEAKAHVSVYIYIYSEK